MRMVSEVRADSTARLCVKEHRPILRKCADVQTPQALDA
jgi:hypothetical protein